MSASDSANSVTLLLRNLEDGRDSAVAQLFELYFDRLVQIARKRLGGLPAKRDLDEDVALRSFHSLCRRMRDRERPLRFDDRNEFWGLLATRTISRAIDVIRSHRCEEPSGDRVLREILGREPSPEAAVAMADECQRLLDLLDDPELRQIALWKVEGWTNEEIAVKLACVLRTVERKLARIRILWRDEWIEFSA